MLLPAIATAQSGEVSNCGGSPGAINTDINQCRTQTGPQCTLAFTCTEAAVDPEIEGGFGVYNNACACINTYDPYGDASSGDTSAYPITIPCAGLNPGLYHDVVVTYGDCSAPPRLAWTYDGASYDQSDCDCEDDSEGLTGTTACRCTFPC